MSVIAPPSEQNPFADRKRWTQDDCYKMEAAELQERGSYELIHGNIIPKVERTTLHRIADANVLLALSRTFGLDHVLVADTLPIDTYNIVTADFFITRELSRNFSGRGDYAPYYLRLIVEVADATLWRDRNTKRRLYAGAGVEEYWVLDLNGRRLWVYRNPVDGDYAAPLELGENDTIAPSAAPNTSLRISDLLP